MNREEKKRYLNQYIELKHRIESLSDEGDFWKMRATTIPASRFDLSGINGSGHKEDLVVKHLDICLKIEELENEAEQMLSEIMDVIDSVENPDQRTVLVYRYVNGLYFYEIARKMKSSIQNVYYLHANALDGIKL